MPNHPTPPIFLSYRSAGGETYARHLRKELDQYFGKGTVFQDYESIKTGSDWAQVIPRAVRDARLLIVLIHGDEWFTVKKKIGEEPYEKYERRITLEDDWVRKEIKLGLDNDLVIFPVILSGKVKKDHFDEKAMKKGVVPEDILPFLRKQLHPLNWGTDKALASSIEELIQDIEAADIGLSRQAASERETDPTPSAIDYLEELPLSGELYQALCHLDSPFVGTNYFREETSPLFFGREKEISDLYYKYLKDLAPGQILLVYGASGVGKSSLLHAGLLPRLKYRGWACSARRRADYKKHPQGYSGAIQEWILPDVEGDKKPEPVDNPQPQLILLDQVEELWTDPIEQENITDFFDKIGELVTTRPQVKLILSFRKEYLSEIRLALKDKVNYREFPIVAMEEGGIRRAIHGAFRDEQVREQFPGYQALDPRLETALVEDVCQDEQSNIAPLLQYQLASLWDKAYRKNPAAIHLGSELYEPSTSLATFLNEQKLPVVAAQFPEAARSGLINDLLYFYTSAKETAIDQPDTALWHRYSQLPLKDVKTLRDALVNQYLLIRDDTGSRTRLAHDTLAPLVRKRYENSDAPGQLARPIILAKNKLLQQGQEPKFSATDIENIHEGLAGMPAIPDRLAKIIEKEEERLEQEQRQRFDLFSGETDRLLEVFELRDASQSWQLAIKEGLDKQATFQRGVALLQAWVEAGKSGEKAQQVYDQLKAMDPNLPNDMVLSGNLREMPLASLKDKDQYQDLVGDLKKRFYPTMLPIEGGEYTQGDALGDGFFSKEEVPHKVRVHDFWMADTPVTFWQYGLYCQEKKEGEVPGDSGFGRGDHPVINVNWYEAIDYCNWLSQKEGWQAVYQVDGQEVQVNWQADGYRLPTEAEWEFAARERGKPIRFGNGTMIADTAEMNFNVEHAYNEQYAKVNGERIFKPGGRAKKATTPVRTYAPNGIGLFDLSGNVLEWCWDRYDEAYYQTFGREQAADNPTGPENGSKRVVRGGSWYNLALDCRCSSRYGLLPILQSNRVGFRVARRLN